MKKTINNLMRLFKIIFDMDKMVILLIIIRSILNAIIPFGAIIISGNVIDKLTTHQSYEDIILLAVLGCFMVFVFYFIQNILHKFCEVKKNVCVRQYDTLIAKQTVNIKYEYLEGEEIQALRARIREDNNWGYGLYGMFTLIEDFLQRLCTMIISVFMLVPLLFSNWIIAVSCLIFFICELGSIVLLLKARKKDYEQQMKSMNEIEKTNRLVAFFTNDISYKAGKDIRLYQAQDIINSKGAESYFVTRKEISKNIGNRMGKSDGFSGFIIGISEGIAYLLVAYQALKAVISVGRVVTYAGAINQFTSALSNLVININEIIVHTNRFLSTFAYLNIPIDKDTGKETIDIEKEKISTIEFCDVSFAYPNSEKLVLKNVNMTIKSGEQLAVVGMNGSGKTTFIKLLCRLYKPTSGKILLNGVDINDIEMDNYLKMLSVVFQDFSLFAIPIVDNICMGNDIDENAVHKIIEQVGLAERIKKEKDGINTPIFHELYENGIEPSGGEAQKLALARAIYKNSPVLILDEPTAALDPLSEGYLYSKFSEIANGKTAIFISHRLASCKFCDNIAVFNDGSVIQYGSHKELMKCVEGKYYVLWNAQATYYK